MGFVALNAELESKRLELLKAAIPQLSRVVVRAAGAARAARLYSRTDIGRHAGR